MRAGRMGKIEPDMRDDPKDRNVVAAAVAAEPLSS